MNNTRRNARVGSASIHAHSNPCTIPCCHAPAEPLPVTLYLIGNPIQPIRSVPHSCIPYPPLAEAKPLPSPQSWQCIHIPPPSLHPSPLSLFLSPQHTIRLPLLPPVVSPLGRHVNPSAAGFPRINHSAFRHYQSPGLRFNLHPPSPHARGSTPSSTFWLSTIPSSSAAPDDRPRQPVPVTRSSSA